MHTSFKKELLIYIIFFLSITNSGFAQDKIDNFLISNNIVRSNFLVINNNRIIPGKYFKIYKSYQDSVVKITSIKILNTKNNDSISIEFVIKNSETKGFDILIPEWKPKLKNLIKPSFFDGLFQSHDALLKFGFYENDKKTQHYQVLKIEIPEPFWAYFWGYASVVLVFFIAWLIMDWSVIKNKKESFPTMMKRAIKFPLRLAVTPGNNYSLSLMQVVIWTTVIIIGTNFVWKMTQTFMDITQDVLILLGIGGSTAVIARMQTISRFQLIPMKYRKLIKVRESPKLSDLISINGRPNIIKFQMFVFTFIIAGTVLKEMFHEYCFPDLPDGLLTLMGVSSAVYVGNDISNGISESDIKQKIELLENEFNILSDDDLSKVPDKRLSDIKHLIEEYLS